MQKYKCTVCGYIYDPAKGDGTPSAPPNTAFESLPDTWKCPVWGWVRINSRKLLNENGRKNDEQ